MLLVVAAAAVLLGTLYPLVIDALGMGKMSVGPPYFDAVFVPLMAPALFLMGVGPMARWRQASVLDLARAAALGLRRQRWSARWSRSFALGHWTPMIGFGLLLAAWIASTARAEPGEPACADGSPSWWPRASRPSPGSYYGMLLAHFGVAVFIVGVTVVSGFQSENDVRMEVGDTASAGGYTFRCEGVREVNGPELRRRAARSTSAATARR